MSEDLRLDGRVAVVTGGGRGLGRHHALLLSQRGCSVVVNGTTRTVLDEVVSEIRAGGGKAVVSLADVSTQQGGQTIVDAATNAFGRIDIIVNNAGILYQPHSRSFLDADLDSFQRMWLVHVGGAINVIRAAWSHFTGQHHGRIINTSSPAAYFGARSQPEYSAAKSAIHGLTRSLAAEGAEFGIHVNQIVPNAATRLMNRDAWSEDPDALDAMRQELISPVVVWLAHETCPANGECFGVTAGNIAQVSIGQTEGYWDLRLSPEAIREHLSEVTDSRLVVQTGTVRNYQGWIVDRRPSKRPKV